MLYDLLRPALFRLSADDPERAHEWVMHLLALANRAPAPLAGWIAGHTVKSPRLQQRLLGLTFPNPVGVAAGFDKNAVALRALAALGFGFVEAGTVTYRPQPGNERPRIVRLPEHAALINRMGFNNDGAAVVARRLARTGPLPIPLGISLGKSRVTPIEHAVEDYRASFRLLAPHAGYVAVNVSSPNTPGLRRLQERDQIESLLTALQHEADGLAARSGRRIPLLVKVAPDLTDAALRELLDVCLDRQIDGVIAVNTTIGRPVDLTPRPPSLAGKGELGSPGPPVSRSTPANETGLAIARHDSPFPAREGGRGVRSEGGLSGRPLFPRAIEVVGFIAAHTEGRLPIIGVGGIFTAEDAYAMIRAGASLIQVYTGLIYEGPAIARRINRGLLRLMARDGLRSLAEAHGRTDHDRLRCAAGGVDGGRERVI